MANANKIDTPAYLIKRLKESGYIVIRLFQKYSKADPRKWTIMVDPADASIMITCYSNYPSLNDVTFEFNDGGRRFPKNFQLTTRSVEVIILQLLEKGVATFDKTNPFFKERIKEVNETRNR